MLRALTVRTLKPGTFEEFRVAFTSFDDADNPPPAGCGSTCSATPRTPMR